MKIQRVYVHILLIKSYCNARIRKKVSFKIRVKFLCNVDLSQMTSTVILEIKPSAAMRQIKKTTLNLSRLHHKSKARGRTQTTKEDNTISIYFNDPMSAWFRTWLFLNAIHVFFLNLIHSSNSSSTQNCTAG